MRVALNILLLYTSFTSFAQQTFNNLDSFMEYATKKSISLKTNETRLLQAKKAKLAAAISVLDPSGNGNLSYTNNTKLPLNIINGQELQMGTKYNTNFNLYNEIKLFNLGGWENLKLAKININLTNSNNLISLKSMHENIATAYYNIVTLQEQLKSANKNLAVADTLFQIATNKYILGLVKQQDVNDTKVNVLNMQETINQLRIMINQYYISLKILADIPDNELIEITEKLEQISNWSKKEVIYNDLNANNSLLKEKYALSNFKQIIKSNLPTLSFFASQTNQQFNQDYKIFNGTWQNSQYIGIKLSLPMPNTASISNKSKAKFDYEIAKQNTQQAKIKAELDQKQLSYDFDKAFSQYQTNNEILFLRTDSYQKNKNLYKEGILGLDQTLNSYNVMVNANYSMISSQVNVLLASAKIEINNAIK